MKKTYILKYYVKSPISKLGAPPVLNKKAYDNLFFTKDAARVVSMLSIVVNNKAYVYHAGKKSHLICVYLNGQCERKDYK